MLSAAVGGLCLGSGKGSDGLQQARPAGPGLRAEALSAASSRSFSNDPSYPLPLSPAHWTLLGTRGRKAAICHNGSSV